MKRLFYTTLLLTSFFYLPFPVVFAVTTLAAFFMPFLWLEIVIIGILFDMIHGTYSPTDWVYIPVMTIVMLGTLGVISLIRKRMSFHV